LSLATSTVRRRSKWRYLANFRDGRGAEGNEQVPVAHVELLPGSGALTVI
jgi:hypothetical protein